MVPHHRISARARLRALSSAGPLVRSAGVLALALGLCMTGAARAQEAPPTWKHYPTPARAPESAPNVLVVLTDDVGFSAVSSLGGPILPACRTMPATRGKACAAGGGGGGGDGTLGLGVCAGS